MRLSAGPGSLPTFSCFVVFFNDTATTEIYTLSLHDALPIYITQVHFRAYGHHSIFFGAGGVRDRKSTRLNSSHGSISYAVFCLKKKTQLKSSHGSISYAVFCLTKHKQWHTR